ncbi:hypothetical protein [Serratia sp. D1N4]
MKKTAITAVLLATLSFSGAIVAAQGLKQYRIEYRIAGDSKIYGEIIFAFNTSEAWNTLKKKQKNGGSELIQMKVREMK